MNNKIIEMLNIDINYIDKQLISIEKTKEEFLKQREIKSRKIDLINQLYKKYKSIYLENRTFYVKDIEFLYEDNLKIYEDSLNKFLFYKEYDIDDENKIMVYFSKPLELEDFNEDIIKSLSIILKNKLNIKDILE
jgi:hypothetical protein